MTVGQSNLIDGTGFMDSSCTTLVVYHIMLTETLRRCAADHRLSSP